MNCLHAAGSEGHLGGKVGELALLRGVANDIGALRSLSASEAAEHRIPEFGARVRHGERGAALAAFGVHHIGAGILHVLIQGRDLVRGDGLGGRHLREQRQNRCARMASDDGHIDGCHGGTGELMHELVRANNVKACDPTNLAWVQALLLVKLAHGRHHGVDRVHNQSHDGVRAKLGTCLNDVFGNASIDSEQVCPRHARLAGHASWHQYQIAAAQTLAQGTDGLVVLVNRVAFHLGLGLDV
mmetsp:Transcript_34759/g.91867  ORF Transcript_34759/g.91867 Transcript_34759/m.91867 type:complete len:242 (+) Transcript_34759:204-929(+)